MRKIKEGELTVMYDSDFVGSSSGILDLGVVSATKFSTIGKNSNSPFLHSFIPAYAFISTCVVRLGSSISHILTIGTLSEIFSSIVESIMVYMVNLLRWAYSDNYVVHFNQLSFVSNPSRSVESIRVFLPCSAPVPLIKPIVIFGVHDCILSFGKWNKAVRWVGRLSNWMAFCGTLLGHIPTSNGIVLLNRHFSMEVC
jgi:hypothetical protein